MDAQRRREFAKLCSGWLHASTPWLITALSRNEKFDARGGDQHLPDFVLEDPIGVGDSSRKCMSSSQDSIR